MFKVTWFRSPVVASSALDPRRKPRRLTRFVPAPASYGGPLLETRSLAGLLLSGHDAGPTADESEQAAAHNGLATLLQTIGQEVNSLQTQSSILSAVGGNVAPFNGPLQPAVAASDIIWPIYVHDQSLSDTNIMFEAYLRNSDASIVLVPTQDEGYTVDAHLTSNLPAVGDGEAKDVFLNRDSLYGVTPTYPGSIQVQDSENLTLDCGSGCGKYFDITDQISNPNGYSSSNEAFDFTTYDGTAKSIGGAWAGPLVEQGTFLIGANPSGAIYSTDNWSFQFSADGVSVQASMYGASITYSTPSGLESASISSATGYTLSVNFVYVPTAQYNQVQIYSYHDLGASSSPPAGWTASDSLMWEYTATVRG